MIDFHLPSISPIAASTEQPGVQSKREWRALAMTVSFSTLCALFVRIVATQK
ncbi:hypothetical protein [Paracoccus zhejiangensis]|uniref:hypothetical protein n=1 Tax=Paracoccus zhejiangensis TaxID=1077935 RepID=UPI001E4AD064|nr:hypothetical protein [Paracoccus zhejiangensis]